MHELFVGTKYRSASIESRHTRHTSILITNMINAGEIVVAEFSNGNRLVFHLFRHVYIVCINHFFRAVNIQDDTFHEDDYGDRLKIFSILCTLYSKKNDDKIFSYQHKLTPTEGECIQYFKSVPYYQCLLTIQHMEMSLLGPRHATCQFHTSLNGEDDIPTIPIAIWLTGLCNKELLPQLLPRINDGIGIPSPPKSSAQATDPNPVLRLRASSTSQSSTQDKASKTKPLSTKTRERILQELLEDEEKEKKQRERKCANNSSTKSKTKTKTKSTKKPQLPKPAILHSTEIKTESKQSKPIKVIECHCEESDKIYVSDYGSFYCLCDGFTED